MANIGAGSLPGIGNFTLVGVNPSTQYADVYFKAAANRRADEAATQKQQPEDVDDYAKQIYQRTTNILPVYNDEVKKSYAEWITETDRLKKVYGKGYTNTKDFMTSYMGLAQKLAALQESSRQFNQDADVFAKNQSKYKFNEELINAAKNNDYAAWTRALNNGTDLYQGGSGLSSRYNPIVAHKDIVQGMDRNQVIKNISKDANGMINYTVTRQNFKNDPAFNTRIEAKFYSDPTINQNKTLDEFKAEMIEMTQGDLGKEVMMNAPKPQVSQAGSGYFVNSKVNIQQTQGNQVKFVPTRTINEETINRLKSDDDTINEQGVKIGPSGVGTFTKELLQQGWTQAEIDEVKALKSTVKEYTLSNPQKAYSWGNVGSEWIISSNQGDVKQQNITKLVKGSVLDALTGKIVDANNITGTFQSVIELENNGKKSYWATIKAPGSTVGGIYKEGKSYYIQYTPNVAAQLEGATFDTKEGTAFNLYKMPDSPLYKTSGGVKTVTKTVSQAPVKVPKPTKSNISDQDRQALEWAKSNPNDPRSVKIMERLNAKGIK